jgi:hemoglobin-like flavoprotein
MLAVETLETSFQTVQVVDLEARHQGGRDFASAFYANLLGDYPELKPLFANTRMDEQGNHLYDSLKFVVANLRQSELLAKTLTGLGTRHVKYGVLPQHYPLVGGSLLKTLASFAGDAWTPAVEQAWVDAYTEIVSIMLEGADYPVEVLGLVKDSK